jgi:hypothetical protein
MDGILKEVLLWVSESAPDEVALEAGLGRRIVNETLGVDMVIRNLQLVCSGLIKNESTGSVISIFELESCFNVDHDDDDSASSLHKVYSEKRVLACTTSQRRRFESQTDVRFIKTIVFSNNAFGHTPNNCAIFSLSAIHRTRGA